MYIKGTYVLLNKVILTLLFPFVMLTVNNKNVAYIAILILLINLYTAWCSRNNNAIFLVNIMICYFNYSIIVANYFSEIDSYFLSWNQEEVSIIGLKLLLIFSLILMWALPEKINKISTYEFINEGNENYIITYVLIIILILIYFLGYYAPTIVGERGSYSTLYEYSLIIFLFAYYYSGNKKITKSILGIILLAYCFQNLIYGGRITALQLLILFVLIIVLKKVNLKKMCLICIPLYLVLNIIGVYRGDYTSFSFDNIVLIFEELNYNKFTLDTAYSAYFTSLTFLKIEDVFTFSEKISLLLKYILSIFLGSNLVSDSNLAVISHQYYTHYYGGIYIFFMKFYTGVLYIPIIFTQFKILFKTFNRYSEKKDLGKIITLYLVSSVPRWYLYSPSNLFRGTLIVIVLYYFFRIVDKSILNIRMK